MISRNIDLPRDWSFFLFGPRQTGKTTLVNATFQEGVFKINLLLTEQLLKYSKNPDQLIREVEWKLKHEAISHVMIDEIQKVPQLLNAVQYIIDTFKIPVILTGSSARKLKRGMANLLGGRALQRFLFPFSWTEIRDIYTLEEILSYGSLPPVVTAPENYRMEILTSYAETYVREEIQAEGIIRNVGSFSRFLDMAAAQFGEQLNYSEIARECQLPVMTVKSYYEILEDTLIGLTLLPYKKSLRKRLSAHPKVYFFDNGVTNAINKYGLRIKDPVLLGRLFEQFIVNETFRHIRNVQSVAQIFFWRTSTGTEVDLIIEKDKKIIAAVEVKFSENITGTHLSGLRSFREEHPDVPCYLVCRTDQPREAGPVTILPWQKYLELLPEVMKTRVPR